MNRAGRFIRERREKLGLSQAALAGLVGVSSSTMSRIENGVQTPSDEEAELIAAALGLDAAYLKRLCDEDRRAKSYSKTLHFSGGFFDHLHLVDNYISQSERLRVDHPTDAIYFVSGVIEQLRLLLKMAGPAERPALKRRLAKAFITCAFGFTMIVSPKQVRNRLGKMIHLDEIIELSQFLSEDDHPYPNWATMLPGMVFYLTEEYPLQEEWLKTHLPNVTDPYILGLCLRDQIVVAGLKRDRAGYHQAVAQAMNMGDRGFLDLIGMARVSEGRAQALLRFSPKGAGQTLAKAEDVLAGAEMKGEGHPFVRSQIARTKLQFLVSHKRADKDAILDTAEASVRLFKAGGYQRHLYQVKRMLEEANLNLGDDFWEIS